MPNRMLVLLCIFGFQPAFAQSADWARHPWLESKWRLSLGTFLTVEESRLSVAGEAGTGEQEFDFDRSFGVDDSDTRFSGTLHWRFGEKWSLDMQYLDSESVGTATLAQDIEWDDHVLKSGSSASAGSNVEIVRALVGRTFSVGSNHEFGAGLGLHWIEIGAFAQGEFFLDDQSTGVQRRNVSADAPLPNIGAWYGYAWSPRWLGYTRLDWFSASVGDYSGGLTNAVVGVSYQAWEHVAFGLDYNYFNVDVDVDSSTWVGSADLTRRGPFIHVTFDW